MSALCTGSGAYAGNTRGRLSFGPGSRDGFNFARLESAIEIIGAQSARGAVRLAVQVPMGKRAEVAIYDVSGRLTRRLLDGVVPGGTGELIWDGRSESASRAAAGVYWCRMRVDGREACKRLVVLP